MYIVSNTETYTLYRLRDGIWKEARRFESRAALIDYLSMQYQPEDWRAGASGRWHCPILEDINVTGRDVRVEGWRNTYTGTEVILRGYRILDGHGRSISPRLLRKEIEAAFRKKRGEYAKPGSGLRPAPRGCTWRRDPVPGTGRYRGRYRSGRSEKTWFNSYRQYFIPEYRKYMRWKAMVPDVWDSEPVEGRSRSWKDNVKCRRQWQKHWKHQKHQRQQRKPLWPPEPGAAEGFCA